jgi:hypothetical protein
MWVLYSVILLVYGIVVLSCCFLLWLNAHIPVNTVYYRLFGYCTVLGYFVSTLWFFHVISCNGLICNLVQIYLISIGILSDGVVVCTGAAGGVGEEAQVPRLTLPRPAAHQLQQSHQPAPSREGEGQLGFFAAFLRFRQAKTTEKFDGFLAVSCRAEDPDPYPDWIRIQSGQWIRIQEGENDPQK